MDLWQQQHEVFSASSLETINFSLPASDFYIAAVQALHKMQKLCHLFHPGWGSTAQADSGLWHGAAVAPQGAAWCKGHMRRSCEKLWWGSPSLCLGAAGQLRPWATSQWCLCLAMYLAVPDLVTWLRGLTMGMPHCYRLAWRSLVCQLNLITTFVRALQFCLVWDRTSLSEVTTPVCLAVTLGVWLTFPSGAAPLLLLLNKESTLFYLQSQDWGLH